MCAHTKQDIIMCKS